MKYLRFLALFFVLFSQVTSSVDETGTITLEEGEFLVIDPNKLSQTQPDLKEREDSVVYSVYGTHAEDDYVGDDDDDLGGDYTTVDPPGEDPEDGFWTPLTITLVTVGSVAGVALIGTGAFFAVKAIMSSNATPYYDIENEEVPSIIPRVRHYRAE